MKNLLLCFCMVCIFCACKKDDEIYTTKDANAIQPPIIDTTFTMSIYPNPCNDLANVQIKFPRASILKIAIYDIKGEVVYQPNTILQLAYGQNTIGINTSALQEGVYFIIAEYDTGKIASRLIVQH
jgi:hypothetical protein